MDLGFGNSNQQVGEATAKALLATAQAQETALNDEIAKYDGILLEDAVLQQLRAKRLAELKSAAAKKQQWIAAGHGSYTELGGSSRQDARDVAKAFFDAAKQSERLVIHFYRDSTEYCQVFHKHLAKLAEKHLETKFVKLNVQDCDQIETGASFLVERLRITVMPTLLLIKDRQAIHQIRGFDEMGGTEDFAMADLARVLATHGMIDSVDNHQYDDDDDDTDKLLRESSNSKKHSINSIRLQKAGARRGVYDDGNEHEEY